MEDRKFDNLARLIGRGASRRSVFKGLFGLGGAAVAAEVAGTDVDARAIATRPTVPPPTQPTCMLPAKTCAGCTSGTGTCTGDCCATGNCPNGLCCAPGEVNCGGACCAAGKCAGNTCCDATEEVCGTVCCEPADPEPYSGQTSTCARDGNSDFCCSTGWQCGFECCGYEHQCCDRECCPQGDACMGTVYDNEANGFEEHCCPIPQICGNTCCDGSCYDPAANIFPSFLDPTVINEWAACCPAGGNVCTGPRDDENGIGTLCCEDPTPRCCVRIDDDDPNFEIAQCLTTLQCCFDSECDDTGPDACLVGTCESDGECTYEPDDTLCPNRGCMVGRCLPDDDPNRGTCVYTASNAVCEEQLIQDDCRTVVCDPEFDESLGYDVGVCVFTPHNDACEFDGEGCAVGTCSATAGTCTYGPNEDICEGVCSICSPSTAPGSPFVCGPAANTVVCREAGDNATCEPAVNCDGESQICPNPPLPGNTVDCGDCSFCDGQGNCVSICPAASCMGSVLTTYECDDDECVPTNTDCSEQTAPGDALCYVGNTNTLVCDATAGACVPRQAKPTGTACGAECMACNAEQMCVAAPNGSSVGCEGQQVCCEGACENSCCAAPCPACQRCSTIDFTCVEVDCDSGSSCNPSSGICEDGFCDSHADCDGGLSCNGVTNTCTTGGCMGSGDCGAGQGCNPSTGQCVTGFCTSNVECPPATGMGCSACVENACTEVSVTGGVCADGQGRNTCCDGVCLGIGDSALYCPVCTTSRECCSTCCHLAPNHTPCCDEFLDPNSAACAGNVAHCHVERTTEAGANFEIGYPCLCIDNDDCTGNGSTCEPGSGVINTGGQDFCCYPDGWTTRYAVHCCTGTAFPISGDLLQCGEAGVGSEMVEEALVCKDFCESDECGDVDDGCGGTINCGECAPECVATTCEELGCGQTADDCAGTETYCGDCEAGIPEQPEEVVCGGEGDSCGSDADCCAGLCRAADCSQVGDLTCTSTCGAANG